MIIPRSKEHREAFLLQLQQDAYNRGVAAGKLSRPVEEATTRLKALDTLTDFLRTAGQTVQAFSEAMKSERNQL